MATPVSARNPGVIKEFGQFVQSYLEQNLDPLQEEELLGFNEWLENTNYTIARKEGLKVIHNRLVEEGWPEQDYLPAKYSEVKLFTKKEYYDEYKYHRGIWSRSDEAKVLFGPFIKSVEHKVYRLKNFIKKIPLPERPAYLKDLLEEWLGWQIQESDYTSYEAHFDLLIKQECEFKLYEYMARNLMERHNILRRLFSTCGVPSHVRAKYFDLFIGVKRMSGEMDTSLANGFFNLMVLLFLCHRYSIAHRGPAVEGDDGLIATPEPIPAEGFIEMGLRLKLEHRPSVNESSFCGIISSDTDNNVLTDPLPQLASLLWIDSTYLMASRHKKDSILRVKALSFVWQYGGCPVIGPFARNLIDILGDGDMEWAYYKSRGTYVFDLHDRIRQQYEERGIPPVNVTYSSRLIVEKRYGIPVEVQLQAEFELAKYDPRKTWNVPSLDNYWPAVWHHNYANYVVDFHCVPEFCLVDPPELNLPAPEQREHVPEVKPSQLIKLVKQSASFKLYDEINGASFAKLGLTKKERKACFQNYKKRPTCYGQQC